MKKLSLALFIFVVLGAFIVPSYNAITGDVQSVEAFSTGGGGEGGCGGCGGGGGEGDGSPVPTPGPAPVCTLTAGPTVITRGDSSTLSWTTQNTVTGNIDNSIGNVAIPTGTKTVSPAETTTYTMTVVNNDGFSWIGTVYGTEGSQQTNTCTAKITVEEPVVHPTCDSFAITQSTVAPNANLTFNWSTTNVNSASINQGIGTVSVDGSNRTYQAPTNPGTYTYILTFDGNTSNSCRDTVTVEEPVVPVCEDPAATNTGGSLPCVYPTPTCDSFAITQSTVAPNANLTFNWSTTNVNSASINQGIGTVSVDGSNRTYQAPTNPGTYTYILTFDGNTSNSCRDTVTVEEPVVPVCEDPAATNTGGSLPCVYPTPTCDSFAITQSTVAPNANLTFNWQTSNVTNVSFNNSIGSVAADGINQIFTAPDTAGTYTYTLNFDGNTDAACVDTVKVEEPVVDAPVCVAFTANPSTITKGDQTNLAWEVNNAVALGLNNGIGDVTGTTTFGPVSPITDTTYILDVFGEDGTRVQCEAPVVVNDPVDPTDPAISIVKRGANDKDDTQSVVTGGTASFEIVVTNTGDEDLVNVVVTDALEPACNQTIGALAIGETSAYTCDSTNVQSAFTNVAVVTGDSADDGQTVTDTDPTDVTIANPEVFTCADNVNFTASDTSIDRGDSSQLSWSVIGADSVSISVINATTLTGQETVSPSSDTRYVLTATKSGFDPIACDVDINVSTGGGGGGGSSSPRCELEISDGTISRGEEITLTWDSSRARELTLTDDQGDIIVTTKDKLSDDKDELFEGEIILTPTRDTEYTLVVERGSRDRECTVDVEVEGDDIVVLQTRDQAPLVTGISLTEVPYTGFEAGTVMTFMFYALLIAWALYITYVLVIPKTALSAAPVQVTAKNTEALMANAERIRPDVFAQLPTKSVVAATTAPAPANLPVATATTTPAVEEMVKTDAKTVVNEIENQAHLHQALLSSGAVQSLIAMTTDVDRSQFLTKVIADAKGAYPLEDGWVVINQTRLSELTAVAATPTTTTVTGNGSLAEAIVTGNVVAAYEMIGNRPMFALADAAADLDALYRNRKGAHESVSDLLVEATVEMTDEQIADMIAALTGAIDGTYTDESSAVKMAIMKAVKIAS